MSAGLCGGCGGPLDDDALELSVTVSPGPRGGAYTAVVPHHLDRWYLCSACQQTPGAELIMKIVADPWMIAQQARKPRCEVHCRSPVITRRWVLIARDRLARTQCPHCYGPADLIATPDAIIMKRTLRMRLTGQTYRRNAPDYMRSPRGPARILGGAPDDET